MEAPPELQERVVLARIGEGLRAEAPSELWDRTLEGLRREGLVPPAPVHAFPVRRLVRRLGVAAALLLLVGAGLLLAGRPAVEPVPLQARGARVALRNHLLTRVVAVQADPRTLSPVARGLAGRLGAPVLGG